MRRLLTRTIVVLAVVFAAIQIVRPAATNPLVDPLRTLPAYLAEGHPAVPVIARACGDCHSNETAWPWYSRVAPMSWMVTHHVKEAREAVNFSTWAEYRPAQQRKMLKDACDEVREGEMPLTSYRMVHRSAALSAADVQAICSLSQALE